MRGPRGLFLLLIITRYNKAIKKKEIQEKKSEKGMTRTNIRVIMKLLDREIKSTREKEEMMRKR